MHHFPLHIFSQHPLLIQHTLLPPIILLLPSRPPYHFSTSAFVTPLLTIRKTCPILSSILFPPSMQLATPPVSPWHPPYLLLFHSSFIWRKTACWCTLNRMGDVEQPSLRSLAGMYASLTPSLPRTVYSVVSCKFITVYKHLPFKDGFINPRNRLFHI